MPDGSFAFASVPTPEELAGFELNDYGNAMRLIRLVGGAIEARGGVDTTEATLLYQLGQGWIAYEGRYWDRKLGEQLANRTAHQVAQKMRGIWEELKAKHAGANPKELMKFVDGCGNRGSISAMLAMAAPYLTVDIEAFDQHPLALNCRNGTLWLAHDPAAAAGQRFTVTRRPHRPSDRLTRLIDVDHDPEAKAPEFERVVREAQPDPERREFLQRAGGYSATGCTHEQAMFICQGVGRDSKSTILDIWRDTLGGYGAVGNIATFLDTGQKGGGEAAPDIVKLAGDARLVILSEPSRGAKLNEGLLKAWTSGSPITARELREKPFDFRPTGKLWMECNAFPVARGDDDGVWRRIHPILFERQVPIDKMDRRLPEKLRRERAGILNWLIRGVGDWLEHGLDPPLSVTKALDDYRKMSSPFGDWLQERCVWGSEASGIRTLAGDLHGDYKSWAEGQGHDKPMSMRAFGDALHQRQIMVMGKDSAGRKYRGPIRLKSADELSADLARSEAAAAQALAHGAGGPSGGEAYHFAADDEDGQ